MKMNFFKLNNNIESNNMTKKFAYKDRHEINTPVPITTCGNYPMDMAQYDSKFEEECIGIEKFDDDQKDERKECSGARVIVEKLPDSVVQRYLAKKPKNYEVMDFGEKMFHSTVQHSVENEIYSRNRGRTAFLKQYLVKKEEPGTDRFFNELLNPGLEHDLAKTEMGCLMDSLIDSTPESQDYPTKSNNCSIDNLIENLSGDIDGQHETDDYTQDFDKSTLQQCSFAESYKPDNFINSLSYPLVQQSNVKFSHLLMKQQDVDVEKLDNNVMEEAVNLKIQENVSTKKRIRKMKKGGKRRHFRKITNRYQRICPVCQTYVQKTHKVSAKVKCDNCHELTLFKCNKCRKVAHSYSGIADHLLYRCEACQLYKCAHCKYAVRKKGVLASHVTKEHGSLILQHLIGQKNRFRTTQKIQNKSHEPTERDKKFENLIVLKKQKELSSNSEWYIEKVKRRDSRDSRSIASSVLSVLSNPSDANSDLPEQNSTNVDRTIQLYCEHCNRKIAFDNSIKTEIYCRMCGTVLLYKCLKCKSACESYHRMKDHLKKVCVFRENKRESFRCSECNYRSFFQGLVMSHCSKVHGF